MPKLFCGKLNVAVACYAFLCYFRRKVYTMNDYKKVDFKVVPLEEVATDVLAALLADAGFESFVPEGEGLTAYIQQALYDECAIDSVIGNFPLEGYSIEYTTEHIEGEDWNAEWEKNYFQPIVVDDMCVIHSTFHKDVPQARYNILIDPKMAFGTGYHQTTCHMIRSILASDLAGKSLLDMGCGTALLAILARKHGAEKVVAIDIDEFAYENALENITLNGTPDSEVRLGGADAIKESDSFDFVVANINRNILLDDMKNYVACMHSGSQLFISGFYVEDVDVLAAEAAACGLRFEASAENNRWAMMRLVKE